MYNVFKRSVKLGLMGSLLAIGLTATVAMAGHIPPDPFQFPSVFGVDPSAVGKPQGPFDATYVDFSYSAEVDQVATGPGTATFVERGIGFYSTYQHPGLGDPVSAGTTGLNLSYKMYVDFITTGSTVVNGAGGLDGVFSTFDVKIYIDMNSNTTRTLPPIGGPDESITLGNTADDILVASSMGNGLVSPFGGFHIFPGLAAGDFDAIVKVDRVGNYFSWPGGLNFAYIDFNGVNTSLLGVSPGTFVDGRANGSGNMTPAVIPEPGTLLLLGTGLAAVGFLRLRRKDA